jgi:predicted  nucleic acid-binding Zn-ribbon protein
VIYRDVSPEEIRAALKALTEAQQIDEELAEIAQERGHLPEMVNQLSARIEEFEAFIAEKEQERKDAERTSGESGHHLETAREKLGKFQQQLYAVTTTREYDAVTHEQEHAKREIGDLELLIATNDERAIELAKLIEDRSAELGKLRAEKVSREEELARKLKETEGEERELQERRAKATVGLNPRLLAHYERIRDAKDGRGIVLMVGGACGGCYANIPPQTQVVIRQAKDIFACEACGRFVAPDVEF